MNKDKTLSTVALIWGIVLFLVSAAVLMSPIVIFSQTPKALGVTKSAADETTQNKPFTEGNGDYLYLDWSTSHKLFVATRSSEYSRPMITVADDGKVWVDPSIPNTPRLQRNIRAASKGSRKTAAFIQKEIARSGKTKEKQQ